MNAKHVIEKYKDKTQYDLCCSESILYAAREYYNLDLSPDALKLFSAFCGGNLIEGNCGLLTTSLAIISCVFTDEVSHKSPVMKSYAVEFTKSFEKQYSCYNCKELKKLYRKEGSGCNDFTIDAFVFLCEFIDSKK